MKLIGLSNTLDIGEVDTIGRIHFTDTKRENPDIHDLSMSEQAYFELGEPQRIEVHVEIPE